MLVFSPPAIFFTTQTIVEGTLLLLIFLVSPQQTPHSSLTSLLMYSLSLSQDAGLNKKHVFDLHPVSGTEFLKH